MIKPLPLVIHKEEQLILDHRSAKSASEHVPTKFIALRPREIVGPAVRVQYVVAEKFPCIAMIAIGARLDAHTDDAALEVPEFSRSVVGDQVEFFDGVRSWRVPKQVVGNLIIVHAVEQKIVRLLA